MYVGDLSDNHLRYGGAGARQVGRVGPLPSLQLPQVGKVVWWAELYLNIKTWMNTSRISQSASKMEKPCITTVVAGGWALSGKFHRFLSNIWDLGWFPISCKHLISHFRMLFPGSTLLALSEVMAMLAGGKTTAAMVRTSGAFKNLPLVFVHQVPKKSPSILFSPDFHFQDSVA